MGVRRKGNAGETVINPDENRYPALNRVLLALRDEEDLPEGPIQRVTIECQASGEATWRVWTPGADEPVGGYWTSGHFS